VPRTQKLADHIGVIYPAAMRGCAKTGCAEPASASVGLRYDDRVVVMGVAQARYDPNLLELCTEHADRLIPPRGWVREDRRRPAAHVAEAPTSELSAAAPSPATDA
jgi:hypothetical protein